MELHTNRLLLREFVEEDWHAVFAYHNDPCYRWYYPHDKESEVEARAFVQRLINQQQEKPRRNFQLAITLPGSHELIGNVGIRLRGLGSREPEARQADIGYELNPAYWGHGYATEAAQAILTFGFDTLSLHRIWAQCLAENSASQHILEKLGMRLEGRLREDEFFKGRWWDTLIYAILENERSR